MANICCDDMFVPGLRNFAILCAHLPGPLCREVFVALCLSRFVPSSLPETLPRGPEQVEPARARGGESNIPRMVNLHDPSRHAVAIPHTRSGSRSMSLAKWPAHRHHGTMWWQWRHPTTKCPPRPTSVPPNAACVSRRQEMFRRPAACLARPAIHRQRRRRSSSG